MIGIRMIDPGRSLAPARIRFNARRFVADTPNRIATEAIVSPRLTRYAGFVLASAFVCSLVRRSRLISVADMGHA
ncbi:MAG TPA: hypothetical protein VF715_05815 [Thermoleophilaceae bacterium]